MHVKTCARHHLPIARRSNGDFKQAVLLTQRHRSSCLPGFPVTSSDSLGYTVAGPCRPLTGFPIEPLRAPALYSFVVFNVPCFPAPVNRLLAKNLKKVKIFIIFPLALVTGTKKGPSEGGILSFNNQSSSIEMSSYASFPIFSARMAVSWCRPWRVSMRSTRSWLLS